MRHNLAVWIAGVTDSSGRLITWDFGADYGPQLTSGSTYITRSHLLSVGSYTESIEDDRSVATSGVLSIVLPADDGAKLGYRPMDIFSRIGESGFSAGEVYSTPGFTAGAYNITLTKLSGTVSTPLTLHIGTEAIYITNPSTISSGSPTVCSANRGRSMTQQTAHRADGSGFLARTIPLTTKPCVWIGRRVWLYVDAHPWRELFLVSNPVVTGESVTLQAVGVENKLTIQRSNNYTPTYATTLAPLSAQGHSRSWAPVYSREPVTVSLAYGGSNSTWSNLSSAQSLSSITATDGQRLRQLAKYSSSGELAGEFGNPTMRLHLIGTSSSAQHVYLSLLSTGRWPNASSPSSTQTWDRLSFESDPTFSSLVSNYPSYGARLAEVAFGGLSWWNPCAASLQDADYSNPGIWFVDNEAPFSVGFWQGPSVSVLQFRWRANPQSGFLTSGLQLWGGVLSRRNRRPDEDLSPIFANTLWAGLPAWGSQQPIRPDSANLVYLTYGVRPLAQGDVHNEVAASGIVASVDMWRGVSGMPFGPQCSVADTFWEMGQQRIQVLQELPIGTCGPVTVTYTEPDGTELSADLLLERDSLHDVSPYYAYRVTRAVMHGTTQPCVGFGNWPQQPVCQITRPTGIDATAIQGIGLLLAEVVASGDGTSGRYGDDLGDGLNVQLWGNGFISLRSVQSAIPAPYHYTPTDDMSYDQVVETCLLLGQSWLRQITLRQGYYQPQLSVCYAGKPSYDDVRLQITDAEIIGVPSSSGAGCQIFTGYSITCGSTTYTFPDWLAADLHGTGDTKEIDLTPILDERDFGATGVQQLVAGLRDRFGTLRVRWSFTIPVDLGFKLAVGDVLQVTSQWLISATGQQGVSGEVARVVSLTHDWQAGTTQVDSLAWAEYSTGYNVTLRVYCEGGSAGTEVDMVNGWDEDWFTDEENEANSDDYWLFWNMDGPHPMPSGTQLIYYPTFSTDELGACGEAIPVTLVSPGDDGWITVTSTSRLPAGYGILCLADSSDTPYVALAKFGRDKLS